MMKMDVTCAFETSLDFQQTTWCYILDDRRFHNDCCENLRSYIWLFASLMKDNRLNWIFYSYLYLARHPKVFIDLYFHIILFLLQRICSIYEHTPMQWNPHLRFYWGNWGICIQCIRRWLYSHLWVMFVIILIFVVVVFFLAGGGSNCRNWTSDLFNTRFVC
jgi:hypothetical protein